MLREEGYDVVHASNGEEALAWCERQAADVLITDIRLPGQIDGWQSPNVVASVMQAFR